MMAQSPLKQAARLIKKGERAEARSVLEELTRTEPDNEQAWLLMFNVLDDPQEKYDCLKQAARINPHGPVAREKLKKYRASAEFRQIKARQHESKVQEVRNHKVEEKRKGRMNRWKSVLREIAALFQPNKYRF
jgi:hypothetical protein